MTVAGITIEIVMTPDDRRALLVVTIIAACAALGLFAGLSLP